MEDVSETTNPFTLCVFVYCTVYVETKLFLRVIIWNAFRDYIFLLTWIIMYDSDIKLYPANVENWVSS
jgi:hypothetical protein